MKPKSIVDVGCGIGGSSRYLARKYGAECKGITLSPVQAQRAQTLAVAQGLQSMVWLNVLRLPYQVNSFAMKLKVSSTWRSLETLVYDVASDILNDPKTGYDKCNLL